VIRRNPRDILGREKLDELWSEGYTVTRSRPHIDPWHIPPEIIPRDRAYQWVSREHDLKHYEGLAWSRVPAERHPGVFAPWGYVGDVVIGDLILLEKPKAEVEAEHAKNHAKAHQNVADWYKGVASQGFTGGATVVKGDAVTHTEIKQDGVTSTELPPDMLPHLSAILKERDRLVAEEHKAYLAQQDSVAPPAETFDLLACRVRCMQQAIANIRARIVDEDKEEQKP
jgi:hypothetical protein